jgi:hypothetical protein
MIYDLVEQLRYAGRVRGAQVASSPRHAHGYVLGDQTTEGPARQRRPPGAADMCGGEESAHGGYYVCINCAEHPGASPEVKGSLIQPQTVSGVDKLLLMAEGGTQIDDRVHDAARDAGRGQVVWAHRLVRCSGAISSHDAMFAQDANPCLRSVDRQPRVKRPGKSGGSIS